MSLRIVKGDLVLMNTASVEVAPITIISGQQKKCLAFGTIAGGLIAVLREAEGASSGGSSLEKDSSRRRKEKESKKGGKTANGTPVSSAAKKILSICTFDPQAVSLHFHTHVSVDGWSSLVTNPKSNLVILSDYDTAHSEVLEWQSASKTLRRVWEGRGSCPHVFNVFAAAPAEAATTATASPEATATASPEATATASPEATATASPEATATASSDDTAVASSAPPALATKPTVTSTNVLLLLYTAKQFSLCNGKTMKEIDECSARSRDLDIVNVLKCGSYAIVVYESGAVSVFEVTDTSVRRVIDLGKILNGKKPTSAIFIDEEDDIAVEELGQGADAVGGVLLFSEDHNDACLLNPMLSKGKMSFEKLSVSKSAYKVRIQQVKEARRSLGGSVVGESAKGDASEGGDDSNAEKKEKKSKRDKKSAAHESEAAVAANDAAGDEGAAEEEGDGGIGLLPLVGIAAVCMAVTAAVVLKVTSK